MSERVVAWAVFTALVFVALRLMMVVVGFENAALLALAAVCVLVVDSRR